MSSHESISRRLARLDNFNNWIRLLIVLLCLTYVFSLGAPYLWLFDLLRHFIVQYALLAVVFGLMAACRKLWPYALAMLALFCLCGAEIVSRLDYVPALSAEALQGDNVLKVIVYNRHHSLTEHKAAVDFIKAENPDIFFILEANSTHAEALQNDLKADYPYQILEPNDLSAFGMVAASKYPFTSTSITKSPPLENFRGVTNFILKTSIQMSNQKPVTFYALHPPPPTLPFLFFQRNAELAHVATMINEDGAENAVLLGDWNITPYSPFFDRLLADTGLKNQTTTPYFLPSWPAHLSPLLQIPIDHVLYKGQMQLVEKRRGPSMGSDHQAIISVFKFESSDQI